jgi:signal transduction histidine kinase
MPPKKLQFKISSGLKDILGKDLITDDFVAIFELVKNAYDAHASQVTVKFDNINSIDKGTISIIDNGKGMDLDDIENKWLFVAYSAKKEGTEDNDYRRKIYQNKPFAGAKGIGRFSCDRLGKELRILSVKDDNLVLRNEVIIDWTAFEQDLREEFKDVDVQYDDVQLASSVSSGTTLEIGNLRYGWDEWKIGKLGDSLAKLISPAADGDENTFRIFLECPDFGLHREVKNFIFETLEIKTTKIKIEIAIDEETHFSTITTELNDGGTRIYKIKEINPYSLLDNINVDIFYLNKSAKDTFAKRMGVGTREYGSIFLYKNGIRIFPYGEPGEDPLKLDSRKAQKPTIYIGNKDLIGRINIRGTNSEFKEASSRNDGFIKNETYNQFIGFLEDIVIARLEKYVIEVQKWGGGSYFSIEDDFDQNDKTRFNEKVLSLISNLANSSEITQIEYEPNIIDILGVKQSDSALGLVKNLYKLAKDSNNDAILAVAERTEKRVQEMHEALQQAQAQSNNQRAATKDVQKELDETRSQNLFLQSIKSQDLEEVVSFLHHISMSAVTVESYLKGIHYQLDKGIALDVKETQGIIERLLLENSKIISIAKFASKANFKMFTSEAQLDVINYIKEYIQNIIGTVKAQKPVIEIYKSSVESFVTKIRPIELNIIIDNLISNAKRAKASTLIIDYASSSPKQLQIFFEDNGNGIPPGNIGKIFDFGFTTTAGSGIGLFHIKKIINSIGGSIEVKSTPLVGTTFIINLIKK